MAAPVNKIERLGLGDLCLELYFRQGKNTTETARLLTEKLDGADKISQPTVSRFVQLAKDEQEALMKSRIRTYASENMPSDFEALEEVKQWFLDNFRDIKHDFKRRRQSAHDLIRLIETRLKLAIACDDGDKRTINQIINNDVKAIINQANPVAELMDAVAGATRGLPQEQGKLDLGDATTSDA